MEANKPHKKYKKRVYLPDYQVWNKGIPTPEEVKRKISIGVTGKMAGSKHPMYGKHHKPGWIDIIKKVNKGNKHRLGIPHLDEVRKKISLALAKSKEKRSEDMKKLYALHPEMQRKLSEARIKYYLNHPEAKIIISKAQKGRKCSPERILKMKEYRKTMVFPFRDSGIEIKIQSFLTQLGIEFYPHQYMKIEHGYQCDILIPSMNLIIEADGDYWHGNPRRYMFPSRDQAEQIMEDVIRTKELEEAGYKVLRLWECDINKMKLEEFKIILEIINGKKG